MHAREMSKQQWLIVDQPLPRRHAQCLMMNLLSRLFLARHAYPIMIPWVGNAWMYADIRGNSNVQIHSSAFEMEGTKYSCHTQLRSHEHSHRHRHKHKHVYRARIGYTQKSKDEEYQPCAKIWNTHFYFHRNMCQETKREEEKMSERTESAEYNENVRYEISKSNIV